MITECIGKQEPRQRILTGRFPIQSVQKTGHPVKSILAVIIIGIDHHKAAMEQTLAAKQRLSGSPWFGTVNRALKATR